MCQVVDAQKRSSEPVDIAPWTWSRAQGTKPDFSDSHVLAK